MLLLLAAAASGGVAASGTEQEDTRARPAYPGTPRHCEALLGPLPALAVTEAVVNDGGTLLLRWR